MTSLKLDVVALWRRACEHRVQVYISDAAGIEINAWKYINI